MRRDSNLRPPKPSRRGLGPLGWGLLAAAAAIAAVVITDRVLDGSMGGSGCVLLVLVVVVAAAVIAGGVRKEQGGLGGVLLALTALLVVGTVFLLAQEADAEERCRKEAGGLVDAGWDFRVGVCLTRGDG